MLPPHAINRSTSLFVFSALRDFLHLFFFFSIEDISWINASLTPTQRKTQSPRTSPKIYFPHLVTELEPPPLHAPSKITPSQAVQIKTTRAECLAPLIPNDTLENKEPFLAYFSMLSLSPGQLESSCMNGEMISDS